MSQLSGQVRKRESQPPAFCAARKATAVATNSPFAEWDKTFGDHRLCAAIADRITFRCSLIQTGTESYRFQSTEADRQVTAPDLRDSSAR